MAYRVSHVIFCSNVETDREPNENEIVLSSVVDNRTTVGHLISDLALEIESKIREGRNLRFSYMDTLNAVDNYFTEHGIPYGLPAPVLDADDYSFVAVYVEKKHLTDITGSDIT